MHINLLEDDVLLHFNHAFPGVDVAINITETVKHSVSADVIAFDGQLINIGKEDITTASSNAAFKLSHTTLALEV